MKKTEQLSDVQRSGRLAKLPQQKERGETSSPIVSILDTATKLVGSVSAAELELERRYGDADARRARISMGRVAHFPSMRERREQIRARKKAKHHSDRRVAFFHYSYYDVAFKFFVEQVMDCEFVVTPPRTKRTLDVGVRYSADTVCAPFKHILGDYISALEAGANVLVQVGGPCRLGYYGESQACILRDLGYDFEMLNFAELSFSHVNEYIEVVKRFNPNISVRHAVRRLLSVVTMIENLDEVYGYYLAHAGFENTAGEFARLWDAYVRRLGEAQSDRVICAAYLEVMNAMQEVPLRQSSECIRVGILGEFFTAVDQYSNLNIERKLLAMGVELHRSINLTNRYLRYNEPNLRAGVKKYVSYDMGPTSTMTIAAAKKYAREGFDGLIHLKSSGCTPEIDCMPVLQRISQDYHIPVLYLSFDSQTSDAGLDTRLEAFYDMLAMAKSKVLI